MSNPSDFCIGCMNDEYPEGLRNEIVTLRQQLAEAEALRVCADHDANELEKHLAESQTKLIESQAREKVLRDAMSLAVYQHSGKGDPHMNHWTAVFYNVLNANSDSTALDSAIKQAKREALLEAAGRLCPEIARVPLVHGTYQTGYVAALIDIGSEIHRMADKFK